MSDALLLPGAEDSVLLRAEPDVSHLSRIYPLLACTTQRWAGSDLLASCSRRHWRQLLPDMPLTDVAARPPGSRPSLRAFLSKSPEHVCDAESGADVQ